MARTLLVSIIGDSASLERSLARSDAAASGFGSRLGGLAKMATLALGAGALGGLALVLDKSVKAAMAGQVSQAALNTALKNTHQSVAAMTPALSAAEDGARKLGFADDLSREALAKLEVATGSTKAAVSDLGVAEDIARFKHVDLTAAAQMLAQAMTGSQRAVKQLGIVIPTVTTNADALKRTSEDLTTVSGRAALAHAQLLDKMATGNAIIQAVTDKVHGQADAFAGTAAGGMAQFQAGLSHMEESIGNALLPILQSAVAWVNSNWPQIQAVFQAVFSAIGSAINAVKPYFDTFAGWVQAAVAVVAANWPQIKNVISSVMNAIGQIIDNVVSVVKAIWAQFGDTILSVLERSFNAVKQVFVDAFNIIKSVFQAFSDLFQGKWGALWNDIKSIVSNAFNAVVTVIKTVALNLLDEAIAVGKAIIQGILKGLEALGKLVLNALKAIGTALLAIPGLILDAVLAIGKAIIDGIVNGMGDIVSTIGGKLKSGLDSAINFVKSGFGIFSPSKVTAEQLGKPLALGVLEGWVDGSIGLPSTMSASLTKAIQAAQAVVAASKTSFTAAFGGLTSIADQMFSGITGSAQTPAGKQIASLTASHDWNALQDTATQAQLALTAAQAGGDPATVIAAQNTLNEALYQQQIAALQMRATEEQKNLDATNAVKQLAFDKALAALQDHLAKGKTATKTAMSEIEALLRKYGVTFGAVGSDMGTAWVQGLKDAITAAAKHGGSLASVLKQQADSINVPHAATGGYVAQTGLAVIHRGENVVPAGGGMMGGANVSVTVNGFVGNEAQLATQIVGMINKAALGSGGILRERAIAYGT